MTKTEAERLAEVELSRKQDREILMEIKNEVKTIGQIVSKVDVFNEKLNTIDKRVSNLEGNQSKLVWIVVTIIIGALMAVVLRGQQ